jgi:hypothetical protein
VSSFVWFQCKESILIKLERYLSHIYVPCELVGAGTENLQYSEKVQNRQNHEFLNSSSAVHTIHSCKLVFGELLKCIKN